ncbi:glycosyltransferase [Micromonospora siamensis]|uniref:Glycosyltransferase involved in cell wall bisynthesis n=1 Tax=Micromonospora siamensis TaxID=299152 RepID=A0A1C5HZJ2_9ACTN|nr:glycosyltransferase [Micromonospora siamensis]SCG51414.1 Glycosyltransferase involved in cell wall bisynthesis [Micromonospora siamensis]
MLHQRYLTEATAAHPMRHAATPTRRVLRVVAPMNFGGTEQCVADLLPRIASAGVVTDFVTLSSEIGQGPLAEAARQQGGRVWPVALDRRFSVTLLRLLRQVRPDVVHSDCGNFSGLILTLAAAAGVSTRIAHFRGDDNHRRRLHQRAKRAVLRRLVHAAATDIIGVSPSALTCAYRPSWQADPRCQVVLEGLDLDRLMRPSDFDVRQAIGALPGELICLTVARSSPQKRRWLLPPAIAALGARGVRAHCVIVGPLWGPDDERVRQVAAECGVADRVHLLGARNDIGSLHRQADVFLHPSNLEGLPGAVLEGVALGTPTVATDLPGVHFIAERLPGLTIVDLDESPSGWAAAVLKAVSRPIDRPAAMERFRASIFSADAAAATYVDIYRR